LFVLLIFVELLTIIVYTLFRNLTIEEYIFYEVNILHIMIVPRSVCDIDDI